MSKYPEHDKLKACKDEHSTVCRFVEWLEGHKEIGLAEWHEHRYWQISGNARIERLIAEFFEIDHKAFIEEKEAMYKEIQTAASKLSAREKER